MPSHPLIGRLKFRFHRSRAVAAFDSGIEKARSGDLSSARGLFREAADLGHRDAMLRIGCMYEVGQGGSVDLAEAAKWFTEASSRGDSMATFRLAALVWAGRGVQKDAKRSMELMAAAANAGLAAAQTSLGLAHRDGVGVELNEARAAHWLRQAAEQRHGLACSSLGILFENGKGVRQDLEQAFVWQHHAAEQGDVLGQYNLGRLYAEGIGVAADNRAAVTWFTRAALQGDPDAAFAVGRHQLRGHGTPRDPTAAAGWFEKSAAAGNGLAAIYLAGLCADGVGVSRDLDRADTLLDMAEASGHDVQSMRALVLQAKENELLTSPALRVEAEMSTVAATEPDDLDVATFGNRQTCFFAFHLFPAWLFSARAECGKVDTAEMQAAVEQLWEEAEVLARLAPIKSTCHQSAPACSELEAGGVRWTLIRMPMATLPPEPCFLLVDRSNPKRSLVLLEVEVTGGPSHLLTHIGAQETHGIWGTSNEVRAEGIAAALSECDRPDSVLSDRAPDNLIAHLSMYVELNHEFIAARAQRNGGL